MTDRRPQGTAYTGAEGSPPPVPADMPDQQAQDGEDALDVILPPGTERPETETDPDDADRPDPDEAGSGRSDARNAGVHPEQPTPDESTG
ncbi:hypothetical protein PV394_18255 [Streptomyces sp. NE06-03E]|jgi:hypothetical protein|uniref:Uncharacterized protein n=4 Tax=Streptomyces TaxID=1883 RepID=A0AAU1LKN7_9ACTN|nr:MULTISPECIES: hypothetical protein [Streptomyces]WSS60006.1 hypothetical protein OG284_01595 [Streptomyces sp. NBC_01177]WSS67110.1 hypothetical protein OG491_01790 [Streptomyces sp. NBC_01175]WSS74026.1 hypothetical protein OG414_01560 [Streptomyces sp. NBC_01174]MBL1290994.1 hypothetical protein [Streptomyces silvae]MDX3057071.1 hypothetical protein [Streptomyces sp. NE06-03E]